MPRLVEPEYVGPCEVLNQCDAFQSVTFFGTPEQIQQDFANAMGGVVPDAPSVNLSIPTLCDPDLAPAGMHVASSFAFNAPIGATQDESVALRG